MGRVQEDEAPLLLEAAAALDAEAGLLIGRIGSGVLKTQRHPGKTAHPQALPDSLPVAVYRAHGQLVGPNSAVGRRPLLATHTF